MKEPVIWANRAYLLDYVMLDLLWKLVIEIGAEELVFDVMKCRERYSFEPVECRLCS